MSVAMGAIDEIPWRTLSSVPRRLSSRRMRSARSVQPRLFKSAPSLDIRCSAFSPNGRTLTFAEVESNADPTTGKRHHSVLILEK
jgi:hypothetical protein